MSKINTTLRTGYKNKEGLSSVYLTLYLEKKVYVNTGVQILEKHWDNEKRAVRRSCKNYKEYNLIIQKKLSRANDILINYKLRDIDLTADRFKKEFKSEVNMNFFVMWMLDQIKERELNRSITESTAKNQRTAANRLNEFAPNLTFSDLDGNFRLIEKWDRWMARKHNNGLGQRSKNLKNAKVYVNLALRDELIKKSPFDVVKIKASPERIVYLTKEEVKRLEDLYESRTLKNHLQVALRNWLFSFYSCGMRRGDFRKLIMEEIVGDKIIYKMEKLKAQEKVHTIPYSAPAKKLVKEVAPNRINGTIFKCFSDQKENEYIKDIADICKIEKNVTFHVARHTFATLFWEETKDLATLQQLLGHSRITTTMIYTHVSEKLKGEQADSFYNSLK